MRAAQSCVEPHPPTPALLCPLQPSRVRLWILFGFIFFPFGWKLSQNFLAGNVTAAPAPVAPQVQINDRALHF